MAFLLTVLAIYAACSVPITLLLARMFRAPRVLARSAAVRDHAFQDSTR
ncbi:hypothetical protein [Nocardia yamanashiensis]|nr:hypothetical protein [Nocardia yamanashiensis]